MTALGEEDDDLEAMRAASGFGKFRINISAFKRALMTGNWTRPQTLPSDGDVTLNYDWIQPTSIPLAMGAEIAHQEKARGIAVRAGKATPDDLIGIALGAGKAAAKTIEEQPLLLGVKRTMEQVGREGGWGVVTSTLDAPSMFIPTFVNQANQFLDNQVREVRAGSAVEQTVNRMITRIPGFSTKYPPKYDVYGEAIERYDYGGNSFFNVLINPAFASEVKHSRELREMEAIYGATGERGILAEKAPTKVRAGGQSVELTNEQISQYQRVAGELTLRVYGRLAASPAYARAPMGVKAHDLAQVMRDVHEATLWRVLSANPALIQQIREQRAMRARALQESIGAYAQ